MNLSKLVSSLFRLLLLGVLTAFLFFPDQLKISFMYPYSGIIDNVYIRLAKGCLLLLWMIEGLRIYYYGIVKNEKAPRWLGNALTLGVLLLILGVVLEIAFMFVAQSHEGNTTLASKVWFERYWWPVNAKGYRDEEHTDSLNKQKVLLVGDSFAAGHGLKRVEERFGNILAEKLGANYEVYNLGVSGSDTRDEYQRLEKYSVKPDILILEYFPNDIEKAASEKGVVPQGFQPFSDLPGPFRTLFARSYFLNYVYYQLPHGDFAPYQEYAKRVYTDTTILNTHLRDLKQFVDYSRRHNAKMYVVLFPFSHNFELTKAYTRPVEAFFREQQIPVLQVSEHIGDIEPKDRIVGRNDAHASPVVNQRVGLALHKMMAGDGQLAKE
ncbi:SGNH/GDSL hydrolase family protein [Tellurirhabdus rosea]|uniref:SGNH/GDSL hydrolase family protein n=1 Tax=Tellurirhabdus rosea TaxID=2674997 RepID=UPI0022598E5D|nr:SGNH/GDSL hydrolase family protein [Tellurirhabdus rosea]